jgi:glycosyltransferase involved in cell wall biosynthesis
MKNKVSIIVPTYNSAKTLDNCLCSIVEQNYNNIELIVVDNYSNDDTKEIAYKYTDKVFNRKPERSAQRNYGIKKSTGDYVLFVDSDMILSCDVVSACVSACCGEVVAVIIPEESFGEGFWAECKKLERSFYIGIDWMEAARFFDKKIFSNAIGYVENITGFEDYELSQHVEYVYGKKKFNRIENLIYHDEQVLNLAKTCKKKYYYARDIKKYKSIIIYGNRYKKQSSLMRRYLLFLSQPHKLFQSPSLGIGMLFMKTIEFCCGGIGAIMNRLK